MTTVFITYGGGMGTRFNRKYYVDRHLPLVMKAWSRHGLESAAAFFPAGAGEGIIAVCICQFHDEAAVAASFGSPEAPGVMADVAHFTDAQPSQSRSVPLL